ncbi:hypothetical protein CGP82_06810 [Campylobacter sp. LR185c]|nr:MULTISPECIES: hypothetical protein [unclassified Campylobacter]KAA8603534.1 hypothetical protein CGP82_06810 [Campylobacter sp. LR185c]
MNKIVETLIIVALVVTAVVTVWSVLTPNHLFIG